jgi:hypothetical protein
LFHLSRGFIARLAALIPRPRAHLVTYHGVFAPAASYRDRIVPDPPEDHFENARPERRSHREAENAESKPRKRRPYSWAELFKRVFRLDVLVCQHCGGPRTLLAAILDGDAIRKVLAHLRIATEPPPVAPARPPPGHDDLLFA